MFMEQKFFFMHPLSGKAGITIPYGAQLLRQLTCGQQGDGVEEDRPHCGISNKVTALIPCGCQASWLWLLCQQSMRHHLYIVQ